MSDKEYLEELAVMHARGEEQAYARGLAAGRAEALEQAEIACQKRVEYWDTFDQDDTEMEMNFCMEAEACRDAILALAQQPPPTGGHGAASGGGA